MHSNNQNICHPELFLNLFSVHVPDQLTVLESKYYATQRYNTQVPANENALTQPKFELGICGIIQDVFQGDYSIKQNLEKLLEKNLLFSTGGERGGGVPLHGKFH